MTDLEKAIEWVKKEYGGDVDKWVFTRAEMVEAFKQGLMSVEKCKCQDPEILNC